MGSALQALSLAAAMEESAIRMYERASLLLTGEAAACARRLLRDERSHLRDFRQLMTSLPPADHSPEDGLLTSAQGESILFPGGLTKAAREGALDSADALIAAAIDAEEKSVAFYERSAADEKLTPQERELFAIVAIQEREHLRIWTERRVGHIS